MTLPAAPPAGRVRPVARWAVPVGAGGAAAAVFGHGLGALPLWRDEVASVDVAARPVAGILASAGRIDVVHTAYYLLLHPFLAVGDAEWWVRLPSLAGAVAAVVLVTALAARRLGAGPALVTGSLLVGNPWLAFYAREARPYALATALVAAAAYALFGGPPTGRRWAGFAACAVAATWLHLFAALPLLALAVAERVTSHRVAGAVWGGAAAVAAVAPLVVLAARQAGQVSWVGPPTGDDVARLLTDAAGTPAALAALAALTLLTTALLVARTQRRPPAHTVDGVRAGATVCVIALAGAVAGPASLLLVSALGHPLYVERYVLASVPLLALAAGAAVRVLADAVAPGRPDRTHARVAAHRFDRVCRPTTVCAVLGVALVTAGLVGVPAAAAGPADKTEDLRAGAAYLAAGYRAGDCVAYDPGWARVGVTHYLSRTPADPSDVALDASRPVVGLFPDELPQAAVEARLAACPRVWVVGYPGPVGAWRPVPEVTGAALAAQAARFTAGPPSTFGDLAVTLLVRRS